MLNRNLRKVARLERLADNFIITAAFFVAYHGRTSLLRWNEKLDLNLAFGGDALAPLSQYLVLLVSALALYNLSLTFLGAYDRAVTAGPFRLFWISFLSSFLVFAGSASILFILKLDLSRIVLGLFCLLVALSLAAERYLIRRFLRYWLRKKIHLRSVIIVGMRQQAKALADEISARPEYGIRLVGFALLDTSDFQSLEVDPNFLKNRAAISNMPTAARGILVGSWAVEGALKNFAVDEIIFTDISRCMPQVEEMMAICAELGVQTTIAADFFSAAMVKSEVSYFGNMPLIHYQPPPGDRWELGFKRALDFCGAALLLAVLSPIFLLIAAAIRLTSPGAVFFKQKRVGLNGRIFSMYKFRSMYLNAEKQQKKLLEQNEMSGPAFKMKGDPRVTSVGRILRRYSLDELPQLWNVLRGDMSLVGPRPPVPDEVEKYRRHYRRRLSMRPGLTCTWQVSGRNEISDFDSWMKLDLAYIDNWSLLKDLSILVRTVPAVLLGAGAR